MEDAVRVLAPMASSFLIRDKTTPLPHCCGEELSAERLWRNNLCPLRVFRIRVSGEFACFTRPETKVERFSYPVITPSAARNVLDAICWRPQMRWIVTRITVLKPIRFLSVLRNEVQSKISPSSVKKWMRDASQFEPLVAGAGNGTDGTPRNTTLLRDVAYWIEAYPMSSILRATTCPQSMLPCSTGASKKDSAFSVRI